jgi:hypothetical protein
VGIFQFLKPNLTKIGLFILIIFADFMLFGMMAGGIPICGSTSTNYTGPCREQGAMDIVFMVVNLPFFFKLISNGVLMLFADLIYLYLIACVISFIFTKKKTNNKK